MTKWTGVEPETVGGGNRTFVDIYFGLVVWDVSALHYGRLFGGFASFAHLAYDLAQATALGFVEPPLVRS